MASVDPRNRRRLMQLHESFRRGSRRRQRRLLLTLEGLETRIAPAVFSVTSISDAGTGSFRQAILNSNASTAAPNVIQFDITGSGVETISLHSALPTLTQAVTIEGNTQPGFNNSPLICLDGTSAGSSVGGLDITAADCTVQWLIVQNFSGDGITITSAGNMLAHVVVSGNQGNGITINGTGANSNTVEASLIGTNVAGTSATANQKDGIDVDNGSHNLIGTNTISTSWTLGNVISGNAGDGIAIDGTSASSNQVSGNRIGTNAAGTAAIANGTTQDSSGDYGSGVSVTDAVNTFIGADLAVGSNNIISGNKGAGVDISGKATGTIVGGDYIGTDYTGAHALANDDAGVSIDGATGNQVGGGKVLGLANIISGNTGAGIDVKDGANSNTIQGNYIGTDPTGTVGVGNGDDGISIEDSNSNQIGGAGFTTFGNLISANQQGGITIVNNSDLNKVQGNYIGTDSTGTRALGNQQDGVGIAGDTGDGAVGFQPIDQPVGNLIGGGGTDILGLSAPTLGTVSALGNLISGNFQGGVSIDDAVGNYVYGNAIGTDITGTTAIGNVSDGVAVGAISSSNIIGASRAGGFGNLISGNLGEGVTIDSGASQTLVQGNYIGTNAAGNAALGNGSLQDPIAGDYGGGVGIDGGFNNTIGGASLDLGNLISGNAGDGVGIGRDPMEMISGVPQFGPSSGTLVIGNYIGTDASGTTAIGNGWEVAYEATTGLGKHGDGVAIEGAANNTIGGSSNAGLGNLISGNAGNGIGVGADQGVLGYRPAFLVPATADFVWGNYIGTTADGNGPLGNGYTQDPQGGYGDGISIEDRSTSIQIGGLVFTGSGGLDLRQRRRRRRPREGARAGNNVQGATSSAPTRSGVPPHSATGKSMQKP